jgi:hypothetical protein
MSYLFIDSGIEALPGFLAGWQVSAEGQLASQHQVAQ